ncbi:MAG: Lrp/AsnC family transcriptional regulator, partial [Candidatus Woodwardiibium sp.]
MDKKMLSALEKDARLTPRELSVMFAREEESVRSEIEACEKDGTILGYRTVVNWDKVGREAVSALIELKITPVRDRGFDAVA